jgi:predicted nuclease of predicted toxin-antitoxin system
MNHQAYPTLKSLKRAYDQRRILLTKDRDVGDLVLRRRQPYAGVMYFRVRANDFTTKRDRLAATIQANDGDLDQFIVVTDKQVRVRPNP